MADEKKAGSPHKVVIDAREHAFISGVTDVASFDEDMVVADTEQGLIIIKGANLHVNSINLDNGSLDIEGEINSITYDTGGRLGKGKNTFLGKIFK